jgi:hypothetical protein
VHGHRKAGIANSIHLRQLRVRQPGRAEGARRPLSVFQPRVEQGRAAFDRGCRVVQLMGQSATIPQESIFSSCRSLRKTRRDRAVWTRIDVISWHSGSSRGDGRGERSDPTVPGDGIAWSADQPRNGSSP